MKQLFSFACGSQTVALLCFIKSASGGGAACDAAQVSGSIPLISTTDGALSILLI